MELIFDTAKLNINFSNVNVPILRRSGIWRSEHGKIIQELKSSDKNVSIRMCVDELKRRYNSKE